ncbi:MAG: AAA family ATPase, partial [Planctomycetota bacterium]
MVTKRTTKKTSRKKQDQILGAPDPAIEPTHPAPKPLASVLGHDRPIHQLTAAIESERLHHAWVFHGPKGVGKLTTALAFAALVLDPTTERDLSGNLAPDPAGRVQSLLQAGTHPDLHVITKELARYSTERSVRESKLTTIPKDVVETHLLRPAALAPQLNSGALATKVFIVDEAELLDRSPTNAPVQNALLKTLEEPAPGTLIILVTSDEQRLLPTIRSRCQRVRFAPLPGDAMQHWTKSQDLTPDQADWALRFGQGSPGLVLEAIATGQDRWRARIE